MEQGCYPVIALLMSLFVIGDVECNAQQQNYQQPDYQPDYHANEEQKYSEGDFLDYSANAEPNEILCYSCIFEIRNGHESGMPGCDKRFIKTGIPTVSCAGPCGTKFQKLGPEQFMMTRNCVPACKEARTETDSTECCHSSLCNGAAGAGNFRTASSVMVAVACSIFALILR